MMSFWICVVPSGIVNMRASRRQRSTRFSVARPFAPRHWIAVEQTRTAASVA